MSSILDREDEYYENLRERYESAALNAQEPQETQDWLFLDEEIDELEEKHGCTLTELTECDLSEIVEEFTGIYPDSAVYDPSMYGIHYTIAA